MQKARQMYWEDLKDCRNTLLIGDGDGRFSSFLLERMPHLEITSIDASLEMLKAAKIRWHKNGLKNKKLKTVHCDIRKWVPDPTTQFDAVVVQFVFDSFGELEIKDIGETIFRALKRNGVILVSEFHIPSDSVFGRMKAKMILGLLYPAFNCLTGLKVKRLPDYTKTLKGLGFSEAKSQFLSQGTLVSQVFRKT